MSFINFIKAGLVSAAIFISVPEIFATNEAIGSSCAVYYQEKNNTDTMILVYNAETGFFNTVSDWAHKMISPSTYQCSLCSLTFGNFGMTEEWRKFLDTIGYPVEFYHKDNFKEKFGNSKYSFPVIFLKSETGLRIVVSSEEINQCKTIDELKQKVMDSINR